MQQLIEAIFNDVVDEEYAIKINLNNTNVELGFGEKDIARAIGKNGRTATAVRIILKHYARLSGTCIGLNIGANPKTT
ncbi:MAG: KH domain-containing protein [Oscillospiraceae bacterium]|nr:KH domain-containing protein [Oscillospiraceae bacterium]